MTILIKGMEMPEDTPVLFCIHPDGKVFADLEGKWAKYQAILVESEEVKRLILEAKSE